MGGGFVTRPAKEFLLRLRCTNRYVYAVVKRSSDGHIVAEAASAEAALKEGLASTSDKVAAARVGEAVAERAAASGVSAVHWDRPHGTRFHGKVASLIDAMKAKGLPLC